jgi:hypothetical protein
MMLGVLLKLDDLDDHDFGDFNFFHLLSPPSAALQTA